MPLSELISFAIGKAVATKSVWQNYYRLVKDGRSEYDIMLDTEEKELVRLSGDQKIAKLIIDNRQGKINVKAGIRRQRSL